MYFTIEDKNYTDDFLKWYVSKLKRTLYNSIDKRKLITIEEYINNNKKFKSIYTKHIYILPLVQAGISNIEYIKINGKVRVRINPNTISYSVPIKLNSIIKLITYGNREIQGYKIFLKAFDIFKKNIDILLLNYTEQLRQRGK